MGTTTHLRIFHAQQRLLDQNYKSLWVPDLTCRFVLAKIVISARINILNGSQPSFVVFQCKTAPFGSELQVCIGPRPHLSFCACKTA